MLAHSTWADDSEGARPAVKSRTSKPKVAAADEAPVPAKAPANPLSRQRRQRRLQWERALQEPADLTVDNHDAITLGQLLEQIRRKHGLNVQIDMPHLLPMAIALDDTGKKSERHHGAGVASFLSFLIPMSCSQGTCLPTTDAPVASSYGQPYAGSAPAVTYYPPQAPAVSAPAVSAPTRVRPAIAPLAAASVLRPRAVNEDDDDRPATYDAPVPARAPRAAIPDDSDGEAPAAGPLELRINDRGEAGHEDPNDGDAAMTPPETPDEDDSDEPKKNIRHAIAAAMRKLLDAPIDAEVITQQDATVEDVLRQAIDRAFPLQASINTALSEELPLLASLTQASEWDLLVQDQGVLLTTRLNANLQKETRVYSTRALEQSSKLKTDDVARVITRTIRPWSWKRHYPDANAQTPAAATPAKGKSNPGKKLSVPKLDLDLLSLLLSSRSSGHQRIRLTSDMEEPTDSGIDSSNSEDFELTEEQLELMGRVWDGIFQGAVSSLQVIYHGDPPTGVVETLPGMLIISQSQGAHREIADLLEQLSNPDN